VCKDHLELYLTHCRFDSRSCLVLIFLSNHGSRFLQDLALGVAELRTPKAVAAAERAMKGQITGFSSQHRTDRHGQEREDDEEGGRSSEEESSGDETTLEDAAQEGGKDSESKGRRLKKRSRIQEM
jgi:hypothetical protein